MALLGPDQSDRRQHSDGVKWIRTLFGQQCFKRGSVSSSILLGSGISGIRTTGRFVPMVSRPFRGASADALHPADPTRSPFLLLIRSLAHGWNPRQPPGPGQNEKSRGPENRPAGSLVSKWWRRGESNPCPKHRQHRHLHVYHAVWSFGWSRPACGVAHPRNLLSLEKEPGHPIPIPAC